MRRKYPTTLLGGESVRSPRKVGTAEQEIFLNWFHLRLDDLLLPVGPAVQPEGLRPLLLSAQCGQHRLHQGPRHQEWVVISLVQISGVTLLWLVEISVLLFQHSKVIKTYFNHPKPPNRGISWLLLCLYGTGVASMKCQEMANHNRFIHSIWISDHCSDHSGHRDISNLWKLSGGDPEKWVTNGNEARRCIKMSNFAGTLLIYYMFYTNFF